MRQNLIRTLAIGLPAMAGVALFAGAPQAQSANGQQLFQQRCAMCHVLTPGGAPGPMAPNLRGVVGRKAGSTAFRTYSPALKAANLTLTRPNLDQYLAAPARKVPGTRMAVAVTNPEQRTAIINFLATQR